jgi:hypothetical protein
MAALIRSLGMISLVRGTPITTWRAVPLPLSAKFIFTVLLVRVPLHRPLVTMRSGVLLAMILQRVTS